MEFGRIQHYTNILLAVCVWNPQTNLIFLILYDFNFSEYQNIPFKLFSRIFHGIKEWYFQFMILYSCCCGDNSQFLCYLLILNTIQHNILIFLNLFCILSLVHFCCLYFLFILKPFFFIDWIRKIFVWKKK